MERISDIFITLPWTTWQQALQTTADTLKGVDGRVDVIPNRNDPNRSEILHEMAIQNKKEFDASPTSTFSGLPVRSAVDLKSQGLPHN